MQAMLSNMAQVMAKTDISIAATYAQLAENKEEAQAIFDQIVAEYERSKTALLKLTDQETPLDDNRSLARSLALRLPYLNSLNWLQVALLKQLRETQYEDEHAFTETLHLVHLTINGIAQGLRNKG
jgi:phosphoenolpyruvate carboxylase